MSARTDGGADGGVRCMMMRGGTSRGLYFLASDLPQRPEERDALLLRIMGSGHPLQIDGLGGAHPLTSKVAVISPSRREDADVDYLFLQLGVERATITDQQNCGNILAGVGPFAVERGLIVAGPESTQTRIAMVNSGGVVTARFRNAWRCAGVRGRDCHRRSARHRRGHHAAVRGHGRFGDRQPAAHGPGL